MTSQLLSPAVNLQSVLVQIERAEAVAIRPASSITLVAVSKGHSPERIRPALEAGHRVFGESRVQEARAKWPALRRDYPEVVLHLIGPLQTNKVRDAVEVFDVIQTLNRPKLALALKTEFDRTGRSLPLCIQVNTGEEPQKSGVAPAETSAFIHQVRDELRLPVRGLMCIPPADAPVAPHFALLQKLAREHGLPWLSMGMSDDFEIAIKFGATHVRVGTAIFGAREHTGPTVTMS
jgi:pyridoxal phosphate enzyme (YggS family)